MRIAINGCGVAGPTLAWWLRRYGHQPVLYERSPGLRTGGYVIDFWGDGYDVADRMGLIPELNEHGYRITRVDSVNAKGRRTSRLRGKVFHEITSGRFLSIARSDLAACIHGKCEGIETVFGTSIVAVADRGNGVVATLSNGDTRKFDLVIGADGLHSHIRAQVFGPQERFERHLGLHVAALTLKGYRPRDELAYITHTRPHRQIARFSMRGDLTLVLFVFRSSLLRVVPQSLPEIRAGLREIYGRDGWEAPAILDRLDEAGEIYFDRVSQIDLPSWHKGRVAVIGDAAACVSLLAGEGTGLAMLEAYVLAGALAANAAAEDAFQDWEARLRPHLASKQRAARRFAGYFAPRSRLSLLGREALINLMAIPGVAKLALAPGLARGLGLPDEPVPPAAAG